jgi:hypothetical protein
MTVAAGVHIGMLGGAGSISGQGVFMTGCADQSYTRLEQRRGVSGMRRVAVQAGVAVMQGQVTAGCQHLPLHLLVTIQAGFHGDAAGGVMAAGASLLVGFMEIVSDKSIPIAAMRVVAGKTAAEGARVVLMSFFQIGLVMAGKTQFIRCIGKQFQVVGLVWFMADSTLTLGKWFVCLWVLLGQLDVTVKAVIGQVVPDKPLAVTDMGGMARAAIAFGYRVMDNTPVKGCFHFRMTGVA